MPLNFKKLVAIFASKFFRFSGTIGKCAAKPSRAGGFLLLTAFRLNRALCRDLASVEELSEAPGDPQLENLVMTEEEQRGFETFTLAYPNARRGKTSW